MCVCMLCGLNFEQKVARQLCRILPPRHCYRQYLDFDVLANELQVMIQEGELWEQSANEVRPQRTELCVWITFIMAKTKIIDLHGLVRSSF